jgi:hypothetical protein
MDETNLVAHCEGMIDESLRNFSSATILSSNAIGSIIHVISVPHIYYAIIEKSYPTKYRLHI